MRDIIDLSAREIALEARRAASDRQGGTPSTLALIEALATRVADLTEGIQPITLGSESIDRIAAGISERLGEKP